MVVDSVGEASILACINRGYANWLILNNFRKSQSFFIKQMIFQKISGLKTIREGPTQYTLKNSFFQCIIVKITMVFVIIPNLQSKTG
jgi:hypothetical protein